MPHRRLQTAESLLTAGLVCPACGYSLVGLRGPIIQCPECGTTCDINHIIKHARIDWFRNSQYQMLSRPPMVISAGGLICLLLAVAFGLNPVTGSLVSFIACITILIWTIMLAIIMIREGDVEILWLLILLHVVYVGFVVLVLGAMITFVIMAIRVVDAIGQNQTASAVVAAATAIAACGIGMGSLMALRALDRYVGRRCIRRDILRDHVEY